MLDKGTFETTLVHELVRNINIDVSLVYFGYLIMLLWHLFALFLCRFTHMMCADLRSISEIVYSMLVPR